MGAMSATWYPFSMAMMAASKATMVLPDPTSPCSRRRMGKGFSMSEAISLSTRFCAAVGWKGRIFLIASRTRLSRLNAIPVCAFCSRRLSSSPNSRKKSSSKISRM